MKKFLFFVAACLFSFSLLAQNNMQDVVYLKNGSIIKGSIIEIIPDKHLKIEILGGSIFAYPMSEIEKCLKEPVAANTAIINENVVIEKQIITDSNNSYLQKKNFQQENSNVKKGYFGGFEIGTGVTFNDMAGPFRQKFSIINGFRFNPYFSLGAGIGIRIYTGETALLPLFLHLRTRFLDKSASPYFSLDIGYSFNTSQRNYHYYYYRGGALISPTFGISKKLKNKLMLNLGLNYEYQKLKVVYGNGVYPMISYYYPGNLNAHTFSFVMGFAF